MKIFGREAFIEWGGIPCLVWIGVICLVLNHIVYPIIGAAYPFIKPAPLPKEYWDALAWIICGLFGKKVGDKYVTKKVKERQSEEDKDGDRDQQDD